MNEDLHRHLDGELSPEELGAGARAEAQAWERLVAAFRINTASPPAPPWLESRIMAEIENLPEPGLLKRTGAWLLRPRPLRVSPLAAGLGVAALAVIFFVGVPGGGRMEPPPAGVGGPETIMAAGAQGEDSDPVIYVQFALEAPGARSVAVAGDFNDWEASHALQDLDGDGVWTGRVPVRPGLHAYMFLVDDTTWMTDPRAERYADDGFGNRNAILAVATPST